MVGTPAPCAPEQLWYESARWWKEMFAYQFIVTATPEA